MHYGSQPRDLKSNPEAQAFYASAAQIHQRHQNQWRFENDALRQESAQNSTARPSFDSKAYAARICKDNERLEKLQNKTKLTKGKPRMEMIKNYFEKHRDILFNIALILLVDHFVFQGAFREKIKSMLDKLVDRTHRLIDKPEDVKVNG